MDLYQPRRGSDHWPVSVRFSRAWAWSSGADRWRSGRVGPGKPNRPSFLANAYGVSTGPPPGPKFWIRDAKRCGTNDGTCSGPGPAIYSGPSRRRCWAMFSDQTYALNRVLLTLRLLSMFNFTSPIGKPLCLTSSNFWNQSQLLLSSGFKN